MHFYMESHCEWQKGHRIDDKDGTRIYQQLKLECEQETADQNGLLRVFALKRDV